MDLTHFIQETDHAATYDTPVATGCAEMEEFQSLSHLAYEFSVLDRSLFPFRVLGDSDLRTEIYGFPGRPIWGALIFSSSLPTRFDFERAIKETM